MTTLYNPTRPDVVRGGFAGDAAQRLLGNSIKFDSEIHVSTALTNVAIEFRGGDAMFVADLLFPMFVSPTKEGEVYGVDPYAEKHRRVDTKRAPGAEANTVDAFFNRPTPYKVKGNAIAMVIPDETRSYADAAIADMIGDVQDLTGQLKLAKELDAKDVFTTANDAADSGSVGNYKATPSTKWISESATPITDILAKKHLLALRNFADPDLAIVGDRRVLDYLTSHPDIIIARAAQTTAPAALASDQAKLDLLSAVLGMRHVLASSYYNAGEKGVAATATRVWDDDYIITYSPNSPNSPSRRYRGLGLTVVNNNVLRGVTAMDGMAVFTARLDRKHADLIEAHDFRDIVVTNVDRAFRFYSVLD